MPVETDPAAGLARAAGTALAMPLVAMATLLRGIRSRKTVTNAELETLDDALAQIRRTALRCQQLGWLVDSSTQEPPQRLALDMVVQEVLRNQQAALQTHGVEVHRYLQPVEVEGAPRLITRLLESVLEWASGQGRRILVKLGMRQWPANALLAVRIVRAKPTAGQAAPEAADDLSWHLLVHTARALGVHAERRIAPDAITLMLDFPDTVSPAEAEAREASESQFAGAEDSQFGHLGTFFAAESPSRGKH